MEHNFDESNPILTFNEESTLISTDRSRLRILGKRDETFSLTAQPSYRADPLSWDARCKRRLPVEHKDKIHLIPAAC